MTIDRQLIPAILREYRKGKGINAAKAARLCGFTKGTWSRWESGDRLPSDDNWERIKNALAFKKPNASAQSTGKSRHKRSGLSLGRIIRHMRKGNNMTIKNASRIVGVTPRTWYRWEQGKRDPTEVDVKNAILGVAEPTRRKRWQMESDDAFWAKALDMDNKAADWAEMLIVQLGDEAEVTGTRGRELLQWLAGGKPTKDDRRIFIMAMGKIGLCNAPRAVWAPEASSKNKMQGLSSAQYRRLLLAKDAVRRGINMKEFGGANGPQKKAKSAKR